MATKEAKLAGNNLLIVLLLVTLLVIGITVLVGKTLITSISRDTKVAVAKDKAETQLKKNLVTAPKLVEAYNGMSSQKAVLADALPTAPDLPSLLVTYENIAAQSGVKLQSIESALAVAPTATSSGGSTNTGSIGATVQTYDINFTFAGNYAGLTKLFTSMETSARPMRVQAVNLNGTGSALSGDISVETFFQDKAELPIGKETIK
jgi:hypothetical protein